MESSAGHHELNNRQVLSPQANLRKVERRESGAGACVRWRFDSGAKAVNDLDDDLTLKLVGCQPRLDLLGSIVQKTCKGWPVRNSADAPTRLDVE